MIISEKYKKTYIDNKIYHTVVLVDIIEIKAEKYIIVTGYLFDPKETEKLVTIKEEYKESTFFKRNIEDEKSDIDAYYLIYNINKKQEIKDKKQFVIENSLEKLLQLDKTECKNIDIEQKKICVIKINNEEYMFLEIEDEYLLMKNTENRLYVEKVIMFNEYNNEIELLNMQEKNERPHIIKTINDISKFLVKIIANNKEIEELE